MTLAEVFGHLVAGELARTNIGSASPMATTHYPQVISWINRGVLAIHTKFVLIEKVIIIDLVEGLTDYYLLDKYSVQNGTETNKYIQDTVADPFNATKKLKILEVHDENGQPYYLNPTHVDESLTETIGQLTAYTPTQLQLQIPYPVEDNSISITCQAAPTDITASASTPDTTEIVLADIFLEALLAFVGEQYYKGLPNKQETVVYPSKFEKAIKDVITNNLINTDRLMGRESLRRNGWP